MVCGVAQLVDVYREHRKVVVMVFGTFRRAVAPITIGAESVRLWIAPSGISFAFTSPAFFAIEVVDAAMLKTTQCHHPLPVLASLSKTVISKLFVPALAPVQLSYF